jgi:hypothetical protein
MAGNAQRRIRFQEVPSQRQITYTTIQADIMISDRDPEADSSRLENVRSVQIRKCSVIEIPRGIPISQEMFGHRDPLGDSDQLRNAQSPKSPRGFRPVKKCSVTEIPPGIPASQKPSLVGSSFQNQTLQGFSKKSDTRFPYNLLKKR